MSKISVLTPTIRKEGLDLVRKALENQTFRSFEWLICSPFDPEILEATWVPDWFEGENTLNRAYNALLKASTADCIISWQDFTYAKPDTLDRFFFHFNETPTRVIGAVGNKYTAVYPEVGAMVWRDPRMRNDLGSFYECNFFSIEFNLASCPRKAFFEVGGYDEVMDELGFGMDSFSLLERIEDIGGYKFFLDQSILSYSLPHERPDQWEKNNLIHGGYEKRKFRLKEEGIWPRLGFLESR